MIAASVANVWELVLILPELKSCLIQFTHTKQRGTVYIKQFPAGVATGELISTRSLFLRFDVYSSSLQLFNYLLTGQVYHNSAGEKSFTPMFFVCYGRLLVLPQIPAG